MKCWYYPQSWGSQLFDIYIFFSEAAHASKRQGKYNWVKNHFETKAFSPYSFWPLIGLLIEGEEVGLWNYPKLFRDNYITWSPFDPPLSALISLPPSLLLGHQTSICTPSLVTQMTSTHNCLVKNGFWKRFLRLITSLPEAPPPLPISCCLNICPSFPRVRATPNNCTPMISN